MNKVLKLRNRDAPVRMLLQLHVELRAARGRHGRADVRAAVELLELVVQPVELLVVRVAGVRRQRRLGDGRRRPVRNGAARRQLTGRPCNQPTCELKSQNAMGWIWCFKPHSKVKC